MKKLLLSLILGAATTFTFAQQSIQDSHHNVLAYIRGGVVTDANSNFLGDFKRVNGQQVISDKNHQVIGYIIQEREVQDANHHTLGYFYRDVQGKPTFTIGNAQNQPIGHINEENGMIQDALHNVVGYAANTEVMWAAPYQFFFKFQ